jgi:pyridoxal phosphate enzyme (YggS family)
MYATVLKENLPRVRDAIAAAAGTVGREPREVTLVAVTKAHPLEAVRAALEAGLADLGENRLAELEEKASSLAETGPTKIRWHMVGHVQGRKAGRAAEVADLIHSVDSARLAGRISRSASEAGTRVDVLFQVNTSGEAAKYGFSPEEAGEVVPELAALPGLRARGLMTMAPFTDDEGVLRKTFRGLRTLADGVRETCPELGRDLSMGMSNDLRIAVEEGSTMVRIGTALFGARG